MDGMKENNKYDVYEPITRNLILESKYEINKYKVRFINEDGSILQEEDIRLWKHANIQERNTNKDKNRRIFI